MTVSQMLSPKKNEMDATQILNNLLKEYDKKLRPDIGGEWIRGSSGSDSLPEASWALLLNSHVLTLPEVLQGRLGLVITV